MADLNIGATTYTNMSSIVTDYSVDTKTTDGIGSTDETYWDYPDFTKWFGYYCTIPELKSAINAFATWVLGKGYETDSATEVELDHIKGWGEDTFNAILWNLIVTKKMCGDAFAEIVRDEDSGTLINLKPLDPSSMRVVVDDQGIIIRYEQRSKTNKNATPKKFKPNKILHLVNDRVVDEVHGRGIVESCQWVIDARNESMSDWRRLLHRSTIRVIEVDSDDTSKNSEIKALYAEAIKKGEVLLVPKGNYTFPDTPINFIDPQQWIKYLENFFYQALGVPKVILGGSEEFTEASSKIAYLTFEQVYAKETTELEADLWNQCYIRLEFVKPVSLKNETLSDEEKNTGQTNTQPNDTMINSGAA